MILYTQIFLYFRNDEREKKYAKDRFLTIFRSMKEPEWKSEIKIIEDTGKIELKNKNGIVLYEILGKVEDIEKIERIMNDEIFNDWKFEK